MLGFITPRVRRLLILVLVLAGFLYSITSIPNATQESLQSISKDIQEYFYDSEDAAEFLKHYANSNIDISDSKKFKDSVKTHEKYEDEFNRKFQNFYESLMLLMESKRNIIPEYHYLDRTEWQRDTAFWNKEKLQGYMNISESDLVTLRAIHQEIYEAIPETFPSGLYKGEGIVLIGGEKYSWLSILSIRSIRSFGSTLPIEVIIPTEEEYEHDLCEEMLPALNAKCVLLYNVLGPNVMGNMTFSGYQYKSLALIASSFQDVFLVDSDNLLVCDPKEFFESEPYTQTGMLVWPDYWERTTSPYFYDIVGQKVDETLQVREGKWPLLQPKKLNSVNDAKYHDLKGTIPDLSSESGQLMINKKTHIKTLVLSLFYNTYGPTIFYDLLTQGNSGEGDKDTFIAAAVRGDETFYQVKSEIQSFGWFTPKERKFNGVSMGQRNPIEDYNQFQKLLKMNPDLDGAEKFKDFDTRAASVFTVHANYPKLNPYLLFTEKKLVNEEGKQFRMYGDIPKFLPKLPKDEQNKYDDDYFDFELVQFKRMKFLLCELNISLKYFNQISRTELCGFIDGHIEFLKVTSIEGI